MPRSWSRDTTSHPIWWLDGEWIESQGAGPTIPPRFGEKPPGAEGVYEVARVRNGICEFAAAHVDRLFRSAVSLGISLAFSQSEVMQAVSGVIRRNPAGDTFLELYAIRVGLESHGGSDRAGASSSMRIEAAPFLGHDPRPMSEGFRLVTAPFRRDERSLLARAKTLGNEETRLSRLLARESGADEVLLLNSAGRVAGASAANIHLITGRTLVTPPVDEGAFPGIVRGAVLRAARDIGLDARERTVTLDELQRTPEVFLTSTRVGLAPVAGVDRIPLPDPTATPVIPKLRMRFRGIASEEGMQL